MSTLITKLETKVNNDWKFAIKNALLIASSPIITIGVCIILIAPIEILLIFINFHDPVIILRYISFYLIGLFVFTVMLLKVIINFMDFYKGKYTS